MLLFFRNNPPQFYSFIYDNVFCCSSMQEFVSNPTPATQTIVDDITALEGKQYTSLQTKGAKKLLYGFKQEIKYKTAYKTIYADLATIRERLQSLSLTLSDTTLSSLYHEFLSFYEAIIRINSLVLHGHMKLKQQVPKNVFITKEDEKNRMLAEYANNQTTYDAFIKAFGHYSRNPFELSSTRFRDYPKEKLQRVASLFKAFTLTKEKDLHEVIHENITDDKTLFMVYVTLREAYKYYAIQYIDYLHQRLEELQRNAKEKNIYDHPFTTIIEWYEK